VSVARIRKDLGISRERLGRVLDVSARTIQRWEDHDQLPTNKWIRQVLVQLHDILDLALTVYQPRGVHLIMTTPQPGFGGRSGLDLVEAGAFETIIGELAGMYEGYLGT
jgi:uncharacterized protein (DUF2384 family)